MNEDVKNTSVNSYSGVKSGSTLKSVSSSYGSVASKIVGMKEVEIEEVDFDVLKAQSSLDIINGTAYRDKQVEDLKKAGATIGVGVVSIAEGFLQLGEALMDSLAVVVGGVVSVPYYVGAKMDGDSRSYSEITDEIWDITKTFTTEEITTSKFNEFYENNEVGQFLKDNSYGFQTVRSIGNGLGYNGGIIALSALTGSTFWADSLKTLLPKIMSTYAGVAGFGRQSADSWAKGADTLDGLKAGSINALWEAGQFALGSKMNNFNEFSKPILNSLSRVGVDAITSGAEAFYQPMLEMINEDEFSFENYYEEYNNLGGFQNFLTQFTMGALLSGGNEIFEFTSNMLKNKPIDNLKLSMYVPDVDDSVFIKRLNDLKINSESCNFSNYKEYAALANFVTKNGGKYDLKIDGGSTNLSDFPVEIFKYIDDIDNVGIVFDLYNDGLGNEIHFDNLQQFLDVVESAWWASSFVSDAKSVLNKATSTKNITDLIDNIIKTMDNKYGPGTGTLYFEKYLSTGDLIYIMGDNKLSDHASIYSVDTLNSAYTFLKDKGAVQASFEESLLNSSYMSLSKIKKNNLSDLFNYYEKFISDTNCYGANQGSVKNFLLYELNGEMYTYGNVVNIVNNAMANGEAIPKFTKRFLNSGNVLRDKLDKIGFSNNDKIRIFTDLDRGAGVCSYASFCNEVFAKFRDVPDLYEKIFGYKMYNSDGTLNDKELLLDLYLYVNDVKNGGVLFENGKIIKYSDEVDVFGNRKLDNKNQVYLSKPSSGRSTSIDVIDAFLKSKSVDLSYKSNLLFQNFGENAVKYSNRDIENIKKVVVDRLNNGEMFIFNYSSFPPNQTPVKLTSLLENVQDHVLKSGGHSTTITGVVDEGFIVSSWGNKYLMSFDNLRNGCNFNIISSDIFIENINIVK